MRITKLSSIVFVLLVVVVTLCRVQGQTQGQSAGDLGGTSWELVKFQGGDDKTLVPDDKAKYTIAFQLDGNVSARIDCNRGRGVWKSAGPNQLEFGPLALTRAMCPPSPLNDRIPRDWVHVRSYIIKDGHLFLSLMADGGIYEFEPLEAVAQQTGTIRGTAAYRERMTLPPSATFEATLEDTSRADGPSEVIGRAHVEHPGNPPISFEIPYDTSKIEASHSYAVRGRITNSGQLMFTTAQNFPVLTRGSGSDVLLLLQRVPSAESKDNAAPSTAISELPATFAGTLPCADCPGIRYQVNLLPDHTFVSRMTYLERNSEFDDQGAWQIANDGKMLVLHGKRGAAQQFALSNPDTLRQLDADGQEIKSAFNYDLKRSPAFAPIEVPGKDGTVALEGTDWKLVSLGGDTPVHSASAQQEPYLLLTSESHRVSGSGGCNRLVGSYELSGDRITFSKMAGTMMACVSGMDTEEAFQNALAEVRTWKIAGQQLDLFDGNGRLLARFEAR